jgi:hypothetical protein
MHAALIGFTRMNSSHNGVRLGQALYKLILRIEIIEQVSKELLF